MGFYLNKIRSTNLLNMSKAKQGSNDGDKEMGDMSRCSEGEYEGEYEGESEEDNGKRLIVILDNAALELVKTKKGVELLNVDDHRGYLEKYERNFDDASPDIVHDCLLDLLDSPLNRNYLLQIYVRTRKNQLIEVSPNVRLPRSFKRFCGLMKELLEKLCTKTHDGTKLLKVIGGKISDHLPENTKIMSLSSYTSKDLVRVDDIVPDDSPLAVIISAAADSSVDIPVHECVSISQYPLSASSKCSKLTFACSRKWGIH